MRGSEMRADLRNFILPPQCKRCLHCFGIKRSVRSFPYRRFGTEYRSHLQGSSGSIRWDRQAIPKRRYGSTNLGCVKSTKECRSSVEGCGGKT